MVDIDYSDSSEDEQSNNNYHNNNNVHNVNATNTSNKLNGLNQSQQINTKHINNNNNYSNRPSSKQKDSAIKPQRTIVRSVYDDVTYSEESTDEETAPNTNNQHTQRTMQRYPIQSNVHSTKRNEMNDQFNQLHIDNKQEHKQELEANEYPKLFHMRFKENPWNPWHAQNFKDRRAYLVINKPGGPGIDGDRPSISNKVQSEQRSNGYNRRGGGGGGRGRGRGRGIGYTNYNNNNNRACFICGDTSHIKRDCPQNQQNRGGWGRGRERGGYNRGYNQIDYGNNDNNNCQNGNNNY